MILKINGKELKHYNGVSIELRYDSIASAFAFEVYFDPEYAEHRELFRPAAYHLVTVEHEGELLLTGVILKHSFQSTAVRQPVILSGYSITGVLEDCEIPQSAYPLQSNGLSLKQITEKILKPFGLKLIIDSSVSTLANQAYTNSTADDTQTVKQYICELAGQKHIIVSHTPKGEVWLTRELVNATPVFHYTDGMPGVVMNNNFDGQRMHSSITLQKQGNKSGKGNAGISTINNPYASASYRPTVKRQSSGTDVDTKDAVRNQLSQELAAQVVTITQDRWGVAGSVIKPNSIISITNPELFIYEKTNFFVSEVVLQGNCESETATLTCLLPELFNGATPKNIYA